MQKKMKIGILTIHNVINYGAALQAYALLKVLRDKYTQDNLQIEIIDYNPGSFTGVKGCFNLINIKDIKSFLIELESLILFHQFNKVEKSFRRFIQGKNNLSAYAAVKNDISNDYDILISGSDQIWNPGVTGGLDEAFYLNFPQIPSVKKVAYASSFGGAKFKDEQLRKVINYLKDFDFLSCREKDGKEYIEEITGRDCEHVLDPSLLLDKNDWGANIENVSSKIKNISDKKYLLIYRLSNSGLIYSCANEIAKKYGLKIYEIGRKLRKEKCVDKVLKSVTPEEFLYLFKNAEYIVTNSFHGTAFSINFSKNFYSVLPPGRTSRITSLAAVLGLEERIATNTVSDIKDIDYNCVNVKLSELREQSKKYLFESIDKCVADMED